MSFIKQEWVKPPLKRSTSQTSRKFCVLAFCFGYIWISFHFLTFHKYFKARNLLNSSNIPTGGNLGANFLFLYFFLGQLNSWHPQRIWEIPWWKIQLPRTEPILLHKVWAGIYWWILGAFCILNFASSLHNRSTRVLCKHENIKWKARL